VALPKISGKAKSTASKKPREGLSSDQLKYLKQKGFTPAKNSIGASFTRTETGRYAAESDVDKALEGYSDAAAVSMPSATGTGGSSELAVLKSIDKHLQQILDTLQSNKQKEQAAAEEAATENDGEKVNQSGEGGESATGGSGILGRTPVQILIGGAIMLLVPIIKVIKSLYDEYLKPLIEKLVEVFDEYIKPFFIDTLPKFFMEDIPNFFTETLPKLFKRGVDWFKDKLSGIKNVFDKVVGVIKEKIGEVMRSIGDNSVVKFFLGDENYFNREGTKLSDEGAAQAAEAASESSDVTLLLNSGDKSYSKIVKPGDKVTVNGKSIIVPETQDELDELVKSTNSAAPVAAEVSSTPQVPTPVSGVTPKDSPVAQAVSMSSAASSTELSPVADGVSTSDMPATTMSDNASMVQGSSVANIESSVSETGSAVAGASAVPLSSGSEGVNISSASMAATEPEPMPGTPRFNSLRERTLATITNPHVPINDITSVPEVSPNLGSLAALLYFDSSSNKNLGTIF